MLLHLLEHNHLRTTCAESPPHNDVPDINTGTLVCEDLGIIISRQYRQVVLFSCHRTLAVATSIRSLPWLNQTVHTISRTSDLVA